MNSKPRFLKHFFMVAVAALLPQVLLAGGLKGNLFSEKEIAMAVSIIVISYLLSLVFSIAAYEKNNNWFRFFGFLFNMLPVLVLLFISMMIHPAAFLLLLPAINFYLIIKQKKQAQKSETHE